MIKKCLLEPCITTINITILFSTTFSGILCASGDYLAQTFVEKNEKHDFKRTAKFFFMGACFIGPGLRAWYGILERNVTGSVKTIALKKMVIDQTLLAPFFVATFFCLSDGLGGKSISDMRVNLQENYLNTMKVNYYVWPAVQLCNFYFVPLSHRVLVANVVALFWNTFLAYTVSKKTSQSQL